MSQTKIIAVGVIVIAIIVGVFIFNGNKTRSSQTESQTSAPKESINPLVGNPGTEQATSSGKIYTMAQIITHKDATSCWTAIRESVYDLTTWISQHPGGEENILSICGKDGTSAFEDQHDGQSKPEQKLRSFKIGVLVK